MVGWSGRAMQGEEHRQYPAKVLRALRTERYAALTPSLSRGERDG